MDIDMESSIMYVNKNISWKIRDLIVLDEVESSPFSVFNNCPFKWAFHLKINRTHETFTLALKRMPLKNETSFKIAVRGTIYLKNFENEIISQLRVEIKALDGEGTIRQMFSNWSNIDIASRKGLIIESRVVFSKHVTRILPPIKDEVDEVECAESNPF